MSQLTHPRAQILELSFRFRTWLAVVAAIVVAAVPTYLIVSDDDGTAQNSQSVAPANGLRYDGGPNEGTRGVNSQPSGIRYDGGPEEGTPLSGARP